MLKRLVCVRFVFDKYVKAIFPRSFINVIIRVHQNGRKRFASFPLCTDLICSLVVESQAGLVSGGGIS